MCRPSCSSQASVRCSAPRPICAPSTLQRRSTMWRAAAMRANRRSSASCRRAPRGCARAASKWISGTSASREAASGERQTVAFAELAVGTRAGRRLARDQRLEPRDVALLVGRHFRRKRAHRIGPRIRRDVVVEGLRATLEGERDRERLGRAPGDAPGLDAAVAEMPAELPAGELGKLASRGAERDDLVLLLLLAAELLELVRKLVLAAAAQEALELGVAPGCLALDEKGVREEFRQISWQKARAHVRNVRAARYAPLRPRRAGYESNILSTRPGPLSRCGMYFTPSKTCSPFTQTPCSPIGVRTMRVPPPGRSRRLCRPEIPTTAGSNRTRSAHCPGSIEPRCGMR